MRANRNGECGGCGNIGIIKGVTFVRADRTGIYACQECDPECIESDKTIDESVTLCVRVGWVRFSSDDGSFVVAQVECEGQRPESLPAAAARPFVAIGPLGPLKNGDVVMLHGRFEVDPKRGFRLKCDTHAQLAFTESERALVTFLARFPQVGEMRARAIIARFGGLHGVLDILDNTPQRLMEVSGITEARAQEVKVAYDRARGYRDFMLFATSVDMPEYIAAHAIEAWGEEAAALIEEDPYILTDLPRVGFAKADAVALKLKLPQRDPRRCAAALAHILNGIATESTYIDEDELKQGRVGRVPDEVARLQLTPEEVEVGLQRLEKPRSRRNAKGAVVELPPLIVRESGRVYIRELWAAERTIARRLEALATSTPTRITVDHSTVWGEMQPAPEQREAIERFAERGVLVVTGGPGTGKSAITSVILNIADEVGLKFAVCAPTGQAAKRSRELTGRDATTIHRLIGRTRMTMSDFIDASLIIVDEASMVDVILMSQLLELSREGTRVVIIGDDDQLPSVGPGRVLYDIISSGCVDVVRLTQIFRQQSEGVEKRIPFVARDIREGRVPDLDVRGTNVNFHEDDDEESISAKVVTLISKSLPEKYGFRPDEIQVIAAQKGEQEKRGWAVGIRALNSAAQEELNPRVLGEARAEVHIGEGYIARAGDRVIQKRNDYNLGIVNGEQGTLWRCSTTPFVAAKGIITSARTRRAESAVITRECSKCQGTGVDASMRRCSSCDGKKLETANVDVQTSDAETPDVVVVVDFGDRRVGFTKDEVRDLHLAYAITGHSSQGSQWRAVVIIVHDAHAFMLTRRWLYTVLTRAQEYVLIIGQKSRVAKAARNLRGHERLTTLQECVASAFGRALHRAEPVRAPALSAVELHELAALL